jgi:hypothetical protein
MPCSRACAAIGPNRSAPLHNTVSSKRKRPMTFSFPTVASMRLPRVPPSWGPLAVAFSSVVTPYPAPSRSAPCPCPFRCSCRPLACSVVAAPTHAPHCSCRCSVSELYFSLPSPSHRAGRSSYEQCSTLNPCQRGLEFVPKRDLEISYYYA